MRVYRVQLTEKETYGDLEVKIPDGYQDTGEFRPYRSGDIILDEDGTALKVNHQGPEFIPYIILRQKPEFRDKYRFAKGKQPRAPKYG